MSTGWDWHVLAGAGGYERIHRVLVGAGQYKWRGTGRHGQVLADTGGYWWGLVGSSGYWRVLADTATVRVQGSHLGAHSELMLWDEFGVYGVEYVRGPCWGTSSGPML